MNHLESNRNKRKNLTITMDNNNSRSTHAFTEHELSKEEITQLKQDILKKILQQKTLELLPYYGLLFFKDAMWQGRVFAISKYKVSCTGSNDVDSEHPSDKLLYRFDMSPIILKEMEKENPSESFAIARVLSMFDMDGGEDSNRSLEANQQLLHCFSFTLQKFGIACDSNEKQKSKVNLMLLALRGNYDEFCNKSSSEKLANVENAPCAFLAVLQDAESIKFRKASCSIDGFEIREMSIEETLFALDHWKYADRESKFLFSASSSLGFTIGAFPSGSNSPVSWAFVSWDGAIAALQTLPRHRRKGLGKAVVKCITSIMIKRSLIPFVFIEDIESAGIPISFFTSLGFDVFKNYLFSWIRISC